MEDRHIEIFAQKYYEDDGANVTTTNTASEPFTEGSSYANLARLYEHLYIRCNYAYHCREKEIGKRII